MPTDLFKFKHGLIHTKEYNIWKGIKRRCRKKNFKCYHRYGGRGIDYCERWEDFKNFIEDVGFAPSKKHSLDRIDNDKGYYPENCRWATQKEQSRNMQKNIWIEYNGERLIASDWARKLNIDISNFHKFIKRHSMESIVNGTYGKRTQKLFKK